MEAAFRAAWAEIAPDANGPDDGTRAIWAETERGYEAFRNRWAREKQIELADPFPVVLEWNIEAEFREDWKSKRKAEIVSVTKPKLDGRDLRRANLRLAFMPGVSLRRATLASVNGYRHQSGRRRFIKPIEGRESQFSQSAGRGLLAKLQGAKLNYAKLQGAARVANRGRAQTRRSARRGSHRRQSARRGSRDSPICRTRIAPICWTRVSGAPICKDAQLFGRRSAGREALGVPICKDAYLRRRQSARTRSSGEPICQGANLRGSQAAGRGAPGRQSAEREATGAPICRTRIYGVPDCLEVPAFCSV